VNLISVLCTASGDGRSESPRAALVPNKVFLFVVFFASLPMLNRGKKSDGPQGGSFGPVRRLSRMALRFYAGGPYRFLIFLFFGDLILMVGMYSDRTRFRQGSAATQAFGVSLLFLYFLGTCWYGYLIRRGRWKAFWENILLDLDAIAEVRGRPIREIRAHMRAHKRKMREADKG
jgi:hypothetical protein